MSVRRDRIRHVCLAVVITLAMAATSACGWRGLNSLSLPGNVGQGAGSFMIQAQMPDVTTLEANSRVRVHDVAVGTVTKIERQDWHALVTMQLSGDVDLPANATATLGQTSLLGAVHVELAPPTDAPPQGELHDGSLIPLKSAGLYPTTEQTLGGAAMLLNGGGLGNLHDILTALSTAFTGRGDKLRDLLQELDKFVSYLNDQTGEIIAATESINNLVGQLADQQPVLDRALQTVPKALAVLKDARTQLTDAVDQLGQLLELLTPAVDEIKDNLVTELTQLAPVLESLANAGPALTRSLSMLATYPWPNETLQNWVRGDYANLTAVVDLTLSRIDADFFTGTRWEGDLTELEMQWGRTIGQLPSPYTAGNPLIVPYRWDQGP